VRIVNEKIRMKILLDAMGGDNAPDVVLKGVSAALAENSEIEIYLCGTPDIVEPFASSASEMVTELLQYMVENLSLRSIEADGMFAGIALDTKNFTVKTGVRTFEAAAFLRRKGADSVRVRKMFKNDFCADISLKK